MREGRGSLVPPAISIPATAPEAAARPASPAELFAAFTALALQGFGGVLPVAQRVLCEERRWLDREEFVELLAVGQALPGPNICNVAVMVGSRFFGWRGAAAALAGILSAPLAIVLLLTALHARFAWHPRVAGALAGMSAVSAGLICGTALKLAGTLRQSPMGPRVSVAVTAGTFAAVALLRVPLVWLLLGPGALGCALAWSRLGPSAGGRP